MVGKPPRQTRAISRRSSRGHDPLTTLVAAIPIPATIHDETGRVLCVSRGWVDLSGYGIEDTRTMSGWAKAASVECRDLAEDYVRQLFSKAGDYGEWLITTKNGSKRV